VSWQASSAERGRRQETPLTSKGCIFMTLSESRSKDRVREVGQSWVRCSAISPLGCRQARLLRPRGERHQAWQSLGWVTCISSHFAVTPFGLGTTGGRKKVKRATVKFTMNGFHLYKLTYPMDTVVYC